MTCRTAPGVPPAGQLDILLLDGPGYPPQGADESEVLLTLIAERCEPSPGGGRGQRRRPRRNNRSEGQENADGWAGPRQDPPEQPG